MTKKDLDKNKAVFTCLNFYIKPSLIILITSRVRFVVRPPNIARNVIKKLWDKPGRAAQHPALITNFKIILYYSLCLLINTYSHK